MSDMQMEVKINRIVAQSGYSKSNHLISPVMKVLQMRYRDLNKVQALRITKSILN